MQRLPSYQIGLWLAEYLNMRCQLCYVHRSTAQIPITTTHSDSNSSRLRHQFKKAFLSSKGLLCPRCHNSVTWLPPYFEVDIAASTTLSIQAATYYDYPIRQAIRAFKHAEDMTKLPLLVHVLRQMPRPAGCHGSNSVILPMPTTPSRLVERGFNPVTILCAYLSQHWGIPIWRGVQRVDDTISQQGLTRAERLTNLDDAFVLIEPPPVKRILLFDDVATTGASLQALARVLNIDSAFFDPSNLSDNPLFDNPLSSHTANFTTVPNRYHLSAYALAHGNAKN